MGLISYQKYKINDIVSILSKEENITVDEFTNYIQKFQKFIKKESNKYKDISGLTDIKLNKNDYIILINLYKNTNKTKHKIHLILLFMYSYYKLDSFDFDCKIFPIKSFFNFLKDNNNIHKLILELIINLK
jgi:hypothetical protein